jgi:hypothetical protein
LQNTTHENNILASRSCWHGVTHSVVLEAPPVFTLHSMGGSSCIISGSVELTMIPGWNECPCLSEAWEVQIQHNLALLELQVIEISTQPAVRKKWNTK